MIRDRLASLRGIVAPLDRALAAVAVAVAALVLVVSGTDALSSLRERLFDSVATLAGSPARQSWPVLVDIDRATLEAVGPWPWSRDRLAALLQPVAEAGPKAVALDILLDGADNRSPAALARSLAGLAAGSGQPDQALTDLAGRLPDGDQLLAKAIGLAPLVLGAALDTVGGQGSAEARPIMIEGTFDARGLWQAEGLLRPPAQLADQALGIGTLALVGDADGSVRRVPLLAALPGALVPGLALELARVAHAQPFLSLDGRTRSVRVGPHVVPLGQDGLLRLVSGLADDAGAGRISAERILAREPDALARLKDAVVIVGGSAPELGGLRAQADGSLIASLDLQAMAYSQLVSDLAHQRPHAMVHFESAAVVLAAVMAALAARVLTPAAGLAAVASGAAAWLAVVVGCGRMLQVLVDPLTVPATAAAGFTLAALLVASDSRRRAALIRQRFEQHLAPSVVQRIADEPEALRVKGEMREVTALFTDVEGFTTMTDRAEPARLIAALDEYFDGVCRIVVAHGGLVDKIIGDAVHALFNVPFDLPGHPRRALDCAIAVERFTAEFAHRPDMHALGFGRTRIGVETGPAIVGDVGGDRKLDYTAYGNAVNAAARLEQANKETATSILVGPGTARCLPADELMALGSISIRGLDLPHKVYSPWPDGFDDRLRSRYRDAVALLEEAPGLARSGIADIARARPSDAVLARLMDRLGGTAPPSASTKA